MNENELRNRLAELGKEYTPKQALGILKRLRSLKRNLNRKPVGLMSNKEKFDLRLHAAESGIEMTPDEMNDVMEIIIQIQEADFE